MYINIQVRRNNNHIIYFIKNSISIFRNAVLCFCLLISMQVDAQWFSTPQTLNGVLDEAGYKSNEGKSNIYIGWDDTYLYLGYKNLISSGVVMYFDLDPYLPVSGGSDANGNLGGIPFNLHTMEPPFRWDMCVFWQKTGTGSGGSKIIYYERNGTGSYTTQNEIAGKLEDYFNNIDVGKNFVEARIKWSEINGSGGGRPNSFNWFAYAYNDSINNPSPLTGLYDYIFQTVPNDTTGITNPRGHVNSTYGNKKFSFYQTVPNTSSTGTSDPFSFALRSFETHGSYNYTIAQLGIVYDMTVFGEIGGPNYLDIERNVSVTHNLVIDGSVARIKSNVSNYTITMNGSNGLAHIGNGGTMYGEYGGNFLNLTFSGNTTLQQTGTNTFDAKKVTVSSGATLNANTSSISYTSDIDTGVVSLNGTVITTNLLGFSGNINSTFRNGFTDWTIHTNSLVQYADSSGGTQIVTPRLDYGKVEILGGGIKSFASETGNLSINSTLTFTDGIINTGTNKLILNNAATTSIVGYDATKYINGTLTRKVSPSGNYVFPIGNISYYEPAVINLNSSSGLDSLTTNFNTPVPTPPVDLSSFGSACDTEETDVNFFLDYGYWSIIPSGSTASLNYDITLTSTGHSNAAPLIENHGIFKNESLDASTWSEAGAVYDADCITDIVVGGASNPVTVTNIGVTSFSNFVIGLDTFYILPIELAEFTGWNNGIANELHWKTYSEVNADKFEVEKSIDGISFNSIGEVSAQGYSSTMHQYVFYDYNPLAGVQYYRLRMLDFDGTFKFSNIISIDADGSGVHAILIYPNPVQNNLHLEIISSADTKVVLRIYDVLSKLVYENIQSIQPGKNSMDINTTSFSKGTYQIAITDLISGEIITSGFVK
ncbi:MAG: T9SS type A sorting domain-containing protein [Chitinophagales bacterium]|nr:T9SS type A sorting domain-containing protein [Chitinophagales bacterium]